MLTPTQLELLETYRSYSDRQITVMPGEKMVAQDLIHAGYLEKVPNNDGVFKVKVI